MRSTPRRLAFALTFVVAGVVVASAQTSRGWAVDVGVDRAAVETFDTPATWTTERLVVSHVVPETGGVFASVERQTRSRAHDFVTTVTGYRRLGAYTMSAGVSATPAADFWYRYATNVEFARTLGRGVVISAGHRYMRYPAARVNQWQPAIAWYHSRGDVQSRLFVTKSSIRRTESLALLVQSSLRLAPRVEWMASAAAGDRIFDLAAFGVQQEVASSWMARSALRVWVTPRTALEAGFGQAHESPGFSMRTLSLGVRRALP